jgi:hypothetical protein
LIAGTRHPGWLALVAFCAAGFLWLLARGVIDHVALYDELLHVLAARGLVESGTPSIADGSYTRAELYTRAVAWTFAWHGENMVAARLPSLVAGAVLVAVVCFWVGRQAGLLAGVFAALVLCIVPATVSAAVFARFYTVHALVITLLFVALFEGLKPRRAVRARIGWFAAALALLPLGWHFQASTMVAAGAATAGVMMVLVHDGWPEVREFVARRPLLISSVIVLLAAAGLGAMWSIGLLEMLFSAPLWAADRAARPHFYLVEFSRTLPLFWPLLPLAIAVAIAAPEQRRLALYAATIAFAALLVHSVAGAKSMRYVYYAVPMLSIVWALAMARVVGTAVGPHGRAERGLFGLTPAWLALLLAVGLLVSQESLRVFGLLSGRLAPTVALEYGREADWTRPTGTLGPLAASADRVVTSNAMKALYYLERYDYELNASIVEETDTMRDFGTDPRTGRSVIRSADAVAQVLGMHGNTLVVLEVEKIRKASGVTDEAMAVIEANCREIPLDVSDGVRAWSCVGDAGQSTTAPDVNRETRPADSM